MFNLLTLSFVVM